MQNIRNIQYSTFANITFSDFSSFIFKVPVEEGVNEEELHGVEIDGILNFENLSRTVFIYEECWDLKGEIYEMMWRALQKYHSIKKKPDVLKSL